MTKQYNVPITVLEPSQERLIQQSLVGYKVFTDKSGNLENTCFSREKVPYAGELIVVKTLKEEAAKTAYEVLSGIEGLLVMPITECQWEDESKDKLTDKIRTLADDLVEGGCKDNIYAYAGTEDEIYLVTEIREDLDRKSIAEIEIHNLS